MKIKEILPWTIESPIIHLVQPSPTIPLGHEIVYQQKSINGADDDAIFALAAQQKETKRHRKLRQERQKEFKEKKESNLSCGYISPRIHQAIECKKKRSSFYDLRIDRSMSIAVGPSERRIAVSPSRSRSLDECPSIERRKTSPDFEDILRELGCESRLGSDAGESTASRVSIHSDVSVVCKPQDLERKDSSNNTASSDSVFYDISLDDSEVERSNISPQAEIVPRKSFSEENFYKNRKDLYKQRTKMLEKAKSKPRTISSDSCDEGYEEIWSKLNPHDKRRVSQMVDDLLLEIYGDKNTRPARRRSCTGIVRLEKPSVLEDPHYDSFYEDNAYYTENTSGSETFRCSYLQEKRLAELREMVQAVQAEVKRLGGRLVKQLIRRDCLLAKRDWHCDWITAYLQANSEKRSEDTKTRFSVAPSPGDSGFTQWQNGMRMVARLPEGIPSQFRKTLWLNLAEKHLASRGVQWQHVEEFCFNEFTNPDDEELGVQIVKDVHRTGCSLFCGVSGKDNQALLKRVLLAYARWNKAVGYCQGFNMLAALILQVMDKSEVDSVKVMIFLIEGVLPESYFANNLRGLSVDMAVFRDLLRIKLPTLSRHFDQLQCDSKDSGTSYEPPLTNVFTMQWFLTLFCNCLPQDTVLRVWDLIFLEGNHVLLCTALAIWSTLSDRILSVESADEFYCIMGVLTREMLEFGLMDANALIKAIVSFNLPELAELREKYLYNITPWTQSVSTVARRGLRLFYSDDDTDTEEDDEKIAIATAYGLFRSPKKKDGASGVTSPPRALTCPDKEKIAMDISALTKQYRKLRERQKQAHVILTACGSQSLVGPSTSPAMNHLLMGKFALVNSKGRRLGPAPGSIPPPSQTRAIAGEKQNIIISGETLHWKDAVDRKGLQPKDSDDEKSPDSSPSKCNSRRGSSSSSTSTELCDDPHRMSDSEDQTNSLSECYLPPDMPEASPPPRSFQSKIHHPADVDTCREEIEDSTSLTKPCSPPNLLSELETQSREETLSISPNEEENKPQQKRKASFRIDPEELRQLDRKLSLKIVEIERRKSSAGIESEDLDSKVLFPFDRDYIQEAEKTDRDTPSSIPDDRMCSSDDFMCGFEEEIILVPDIITTHKPLDFRMTSLEECDETKINENYDEIEVNQKESFEESSEGNDECDDEEQSNLINTSFNFDELFMDKKICNEEYLENPFNINHKSDDMNFSVDTENYKSEQMDSLSKMVYVPEKIKVVDSDPSSFTHVAEKSNDLNIKIQDVLKNSQGTNIFTQNTSQSSDNVHNKSTSSENPTEENVIYENDQNSKNHKLETFESHAIYPLNKNSNTDPAYYIFDTAVTSSEDSYSAKLLLEERSKEIKSTSENQHGNVVYKSSDSQIDLNIKLANLLPKMPIHTSFNTSLPDVAAVNSRDIHIKSMREKYANFPSLSVEQKINEHTLNESPTIPVILQDSCDNNTFNPTSDNTKTIDFTNSQKESSELLSCTEKNNGESETPNDENGTNVPTMDHSSSALYSEKSLENDIVVQRNVLEPSGKLETMESKNEETIIKEYKKLDDVHLEECVKKPVPTTSNRRGSEVALNLILRENSQILSKIHQQSRRSSEVCIDIKHTHENITKNEISTQLKRTVEVPEKIMALNNNTEVSHNDSSNEFQSNQYEQETLNSEKLYNSNSRLNLQVGPLSEELLQITEDSINIESKTIIHKFLEEDQNETNLSNTKSEDPYDTASVEIQQIHQTQGETLPDVCKFDELSKSLKYGNYSQESNPSDFKEKHILQRSSTLKESNSVIMKEINLNKAGIKDVNDPYSYVKTALERSPSKETDKNTPLEVESIFKTQNSTVGENRLVGIHKLSDSLDKTYPEPSLYSNRDDDENVESHVKYSLDNGSDTNEDIIKELRSLDIKPEETLEYYGTKNISHSPESPEDNFFSYRKEPLTKDSFPISPENKNCDISKPHHTTFDYSTDLRSNRSIIHNDFKGHKAASLDVALLDRIEHDKYSDGSYKSFITSSTSSEDDNSLYMSSYKSHGRLLIEKGELNTYRSLDQESLNSSEVHSDVRKTLEKFDESAYELKRSKSPKIDPTHSRDSRLTEHIGNGNREKMLFKYKSEDYESSFSPSRYRFSSASPVRKKVATLSTESLTSPYQTLHRVKSPSPTGYSSSQPLSVKENNLKGLSDTSGSDYAYVGLKDFKRYTRTESLDLNLSPDRQSKFPRKRAESFETSVLDKVSEEKKSTSPSSPLKFNPFPVRSSSRQPKELGVKLGLYLPPKSDKSPVKRLT